VFALLIVCSANKLKNAGLTNTTPATVTMNDSTYILTDETLTQNEIDKQIGNITKVIEIVSYLESDDPYKNTKKIFKMKDIKVEEAIAVQVNEKLYKAKVQK
jgi:uncharacterized protein with ATP-grasp and redox domains